MLQGKIFRSWVSLTLGLAFGSTVFAQANTDAASADFFELKIRPILANNCYGCHTNTAMGGLRVDSSDALMKGGKKGPSIVAGDPEQSILIQAVRHTDAKLKMPMGNKLKDNEIADLEAWVKAGAKWPASSQAASTKSKNGEFVMIPELRKFWSFLPLKEPAVPVVKDAKWAKTEIDRFILGKLESENLKPVSAAKKKDLIRRATLDLIGIPPTFEEIEAFEKDNSPNAFAKVVDRLLASPHYGERWGRSWLDVARYGEDDYRSLDPMRRGFNPYPNAYMYRDWVIKAFNDDLPYDQFVKAQLAGDLMDPKDRYKTLPATGFLGLGPWYYDNGSAEVTRADERNDRVDVITRGFIGLTVACARCHDHKYDPIPTKDYYAISGVFANTIYEEYAQVPKSVQKDFQKIEDEIDQKQKILGEIQGNLGNQLSQSLAFQTSNYLEGVWEVKGPQKKEVSAVVEARKLDYELFDRWIEYMEKPTERYKNKEAWQAMMKKGGNAQQAKRLAADFQNQVMQVMLTRNELAEENKVIAAQAMEGTKKKKRTSKPSNFVTNEDFCPGCNLRLKTTSEEESNFWTEIFQRMLTDGDDPALMMATGRMGKPGVLAFRGWGLESRSGIEPQNQMASIKKDIDAARKKLEPYYPYVHGVKDSDKPVNLPVNLRGDPFNLGEEEPRHFLTVLSPDKPKPFQKGSGRLELAEAIINEPISTRVIVNRIWKGHFDTGLVDTPSNFGIMGERPSNPELLEYLSSWFVRNGLSIKKLHREIMLSSVYQLSTENNPAAFAKDSGNRLYWRSNQRRMDAEQLRDSIMNVASDLDLSIGGPSEELKPSFKRRTVYGKVSRYKLDQYLQLFDLPSPNISAEKRFVTTVPLQRLFLMNSDFMQIEAEALAKRVAAEANNRERIRKMYKIVYGRDASESDIKLALEYLKTEPLLEYEERKKAAELKKASPKDRKGPESPKEMKPKEMKDAVPPAEISSLTAKPEATPAEMPMPTEPAKPEAGAGAGAEGAEMGMGMMGGVMPDARRGPGAGAAKEVKYEPTAWGRYAKVLLSSSEFIFIN